MRFSKLRSTLISFYVVQMSKTRIIIVVDGLLIPKTVRDSKLKSEYYFSKHVRSQSRTYSLFLIYTLG